MIQLHFQQPNNLSLLADELQAAVPTLAPSINQRGEREPSMTVHGNGDDIWLEVPDDADETAIAAIVQAHDATKLQADPRRERLARIAELVDIPRSTWTTSQQREIIHLMAQELIT